MEETDTSRLQRSKAAVMRFREEFALKPYLKAVWSETIARANWLALGLLVTVGIFSYWSTSTLIRANNSRIQLRKALIELQETFSTVQDAEIGQRGYLLVGNESYLEPYQKAVRSADQHIQRMKVLIDALPGQLTTFDAVPQLVAKKFAELKETIELRNSNGGDAALRVVRTGRGKDLMDEIRIGVEQTQQEIQKRVSSYDRDIAAYTTHATFWSIFGNVLAAVLFIWVIHRERQEHARVEIREQQLAHFVETSRIHAGEQSEREIESLAQRARDLTTLVQSLQERTLNESNSEIMTLGRQARELARSVELSRLQTLSQSEQKIEALAQKARELAQTVETSRIRTLNQSEGKIEALGQVARELAQSVETSRIQTLKQTDGKIRALGQSARDLAKSVEAVRIETRDVSNEKIEALGQTARDLATSVETSRIETLNLSDGKIEALGQKARDLACFVESARIETLNQSNQEIRKLNEGLEQRVIERTSQLEAANKELDSFSYSVSHDLRAPLRAIDGFSRILLEEYAAPLEAEGKAYLQRVCDNTQQMGHLVDDLLSFARLGRLPLTKHPVDLGKIVRKCLDELTKEREGRDVEIVIGDLRACHADPVLLKQVWTNLLSNALKYTGKQEHAKIEIGCRTEPRSKVNGHEPSPNGAESETVYFIKDNGAGFDMRYVRKLFGVFQRLHRAADYEGTGVGLAIVQRIVQRHGGHIWGEAKPNEGATFSFTLE